MPPRRMVPPKETTSQKQSARHPAPQAKNNKVHQIGKQGKIQDSPPSEPEIDIQAILEECLKESNERIQAELLARQERLINSIQQCDQTVSSPRKSQPKK